MRASNLVRSLMKPDAPGDVERRMARRLAGAQAYDEMVAKFGALTADNAAQAIAWQDARISELERTPQP